MKVVLRRKIFGVGFITGSLEVDDKYFCDTLEPSMAEPLHAGHPCVPIGIYELALTYSNRLCKVYPLLLNVPGREGIRIHPFNKPEQSLGCIGLGTIAGDSLSGSTVMVNRFMTLLRSQISKQKVFIEIH